MSDTHFHNLAVVIYNRLLAKGMVDFHTKAHIAIGEIQEEIGKFSEENKIFNLQPPDQPLPSDGTYLIEYIDHRTIYLTRVL